MHLLSTLISRQREILADAELQKSPQLHPQNHLTLMPEYGLLEIPKANGKDLILWNNSSVFAFFLP